MGSMLELLIDLALTFVGYMAFMILLLLILAGVGTLGYREEVNEP